MQKQYSGAKKKKKKRRASCIIEIIDPQGVRCVLISKQRGDHYDMIPGGGIDRGEPPIVAAIREVNEETTLHTEAIIKLFDHESQYTQHLVFLIQTEGSDFEPRDDVEDLWLLPIYECRDLSKYDQLSRSTKHILTQYFEWREGHNFTFPSPPKSIEDISS